jgi:hypothetical protein
MITVHYVGFYSRKVGEILRLSFNEDASCMMWEADMDRTWSQGLKTTVPTAIREVRSPNFKQLNSAQNLNESAWSLEL